jgi:hypothetical protein
MFMGADAQHIGSKKMAQAKKAPKPEYLTLDKGKPYNPRTDHTDKGWASLKRCIEQGYTYAALRSKKDTPITGNNHNHQFAAYCVRRHWVKVTTTAPANAKG